MPGNRPEPSRQGPATFLNRIAQYADVERHLTFLDVDPSHLAVFAVVGLGGVGKSRFLTEVRDRFAARDQPPALVWASLDEEASLSASAPLLAIRNQLRADCTLFDVALMTYWAASGRSQPQIGGEGGGSAAVRTLHARTDLPAGSFPNAFGADMYDAMPRQDALRLGYQRRDFTQIDARRSQPSELLELLPSYLALDIRRHLGSGGQPPLVFFYDAYDRQSRRTVAEGAPWLREFIQTLDSGLHLIAARDDLAWSEREWRDILRPLVLAELPDTECRKMIRRELGDLARDVEDKIVTGSHRIPFFLHAAIDVCRIHIDEHDRLSPNDVPASTTACVERLLDHLGETESRLAVILAAVHYFDAQLYGRLVHILGRPEDVIDLPEFAQWFFVEDADKGLFKADAGPRLFKIHDLLTEAVRVSGRWESLKVLSLRDAGVHLAVRTQESSTAGSERAARLFHELVEAWQSTESVPVGDVEHLIDIGYSLHDAGYWRELAGLPVLDQRDDSHPARLIARYFAALATRRMQGPNLALNKLAVLTPDRHLFGRHASSFDLEVTYFKELVGDYRSAREEFRALDARVVSFDPTRRDHVRTRLYHADMLIMDGRFAEASRLLLDASEAVPRGSLEWVEFVRHRGHAFRFSLMFESAEEQYALAFNAARDIPSMQGKLRTNMAETNCWSQPILAIENAKEAIDLNTKLDNRIEVAKAEAARAVAHAMLGDVSAAGTACDRALLEADRVSYPAAACFARQALVVTHLRAGDNDDADAAYRDLVAATQTLGTYSHLCIVPAWLRGDEPEFARWSRDVEWVPGTEVAARLQGISVR